MKNEFELGSRVQLASFHGKIESPEPVTPDENFWKLVGEQGEIISKNLKAHPAFPDKGKRALVKFDKNMSDLGLVNHNQVPNSIWIFISDLEQID